MIENIRREFYRFCIRKLNWSRMPYCFLLSAPDKYGITFPWKGDEIIWIWPWRRKDHNPYISVLLSGNGEFGDAKFQTLGAIDACWKEFEEHCSNLDKNDC